MRGGWETDFSFTVVPPPAFLLRIETVASSNVQEDAARAYEVAHSSSKVCEIRLGIRIMSGCCLWVFEI